MAGPWEQYQQPVEQVGPWQMFGGGSTASPTPRQAQSISDAVVAGLQSSATGLAVRGELPSQLLPEDAPWYHRLASGGASLAADLPLSVVGAVGGGALGSLAPGPGTLLGAGAGGFGVPMALRDALMTAYGQNSARSWADVWEITKSALIEGAKGATIGAATLGAGRVVGAALPAAMGATARAGASLGAELTALTGTAAALEGRMPTAQEFMDNAILLGGLKGAVSIAGRLRTIYAETGKTPDVVAAEALRNKTLLEELTGPMRPGEQRPAIPSVYAELSLKEHVQAALDVDPRPEMIRSRMDAAERGEVERFGDTTMRDPVAYEYIADTQTAKEVIKAVSQLYHNELQTQKRGIVPDVQTSAEGLRIAQRAFANATGLDPHVIGTAENAPTLWARAHMVRGASERASKTLRDLAGKRASEITLEDRVQVLAELERVQLFYKDITGAAGEVGRALHILRSIKSDPTMLGDAEALVKLTERKFGVGSMQDIAAMAAALKDPAQMARFAEMVPKASTMEKVIEGWKAAILSGPLTHMANMSGNVMKWGVEVPESIIATSLTAARRAFQKDPMSMAEFKAKALAPLYGLQYGARDALTIAGEAFRGEGTHLEKADIYRHAIEGKAGTVIRTPFRLLQAEDVLFRTVAERGKAHEMAVERAIKEGFRPETAEFNQRVAQYTMQPELGLLPEQAAAALKTVQEAGAEAVFAQRLGKRLETVQAAMAGHPMQFIVPFVRTPANLLSWAVQHSPGFLLSSRWRNDFAAGGARRDRAIARVIVGTGLTMTAIELARDGLITGGGMFDPEQRRTKMAAGWQPYSIKIGGKYYSYQRIEPVAKVIGFAADMVEMYDKLNDDERKKGWMALMAMFGNATISTTYLSGLAGAFNALTDPTRYGEQFFEQYASSLVPKLIGHSAMLIDPHKREVDGAIDAIQSQIPFLRERLLPKRDIWGEPMAGERLFGVLPVAASAESKEKVKTEAARLELAITDVPKFVLEPGPLGQKERRIDLKPEQLDVLRAVSGQFAMEILSPIVNAPDWDRIPDFAKAHIYKAVIEKARVKGRYEALPAEAAEREVMRNKIANEIIKQVLDAEK